MAADGIPGLELPKQELYLWAVFPDPRKPLMVEHFCTFIEVVTAGSRAMRAQTHTQTHTGTHMHRV